MDSRHLGGANWDSRHLGGSRMRFHLPFRFQHLDQRGDDGIALAHLYTHNVTVRSVSGHHLHKTYIMPDSRNETWLPRPYHRISCCKRRMGTCRRAFDDNLALLHESRGRTATNRWRILPSFGNMRPAHKIERRRTQYREGCRRPTDGAESSSGRDPCLKPRFDIRPIFQLRRPVGKTSFALL